MVRQVDISERMLFPKLYFGQNKEPSKSNNEHAVEVCKDSPINPVDEEINFDDNCDVKSTHSFNMHSGTLSITKRSGKY